MIRSITLLSNVLILSLVSCTNPHEVEDALYSHIENQFSNNSLDLESTLDSLELIFLNEGLIDSPSPKEYRNYYQQNIDEGELRSPQSEDARKWISQVSFTYQELETVALRKVDGETYDESKFGRIAQQIEKETRETGQITFITVAKAHLDILSVDDFEHPFYRANILLSLQRVYFRHYVEDRRYIRPIPKKIEYVE